VSAHFEDGEVSAEGGSCVGYVHKANAGLRYNKWVGWWGCDAFGDVGLKVDYACVGEVDVASPSGYDWVGFDACVVVFFEE
jgi:hypothetical protein